MPMINKNVDSFMYPESDSFSMRKVPMKMQKSETVKTLRPTSQISKAFGYYPPEITRIGKK